MGRRCGCVGDECNCAIVPGRGISFDGTGDTNNPLTVTTTRDAHAYMQGRSTSNTDLNLTGEGTATDPFLLSVDFNVPEPRPLPTSTYLTPGSYTWTRPSNVTMVDVWVLGGGSSGMPGYSVGPTLHLGGRGGGGGALSYGRFVLPNDVVSATVLVGAGGASVPGVGEGGAPASATYNTGQQSWVQFRTETAATNLTLYAQGGWADGSRAAGTYRGQASRTATDTIPGSNIPSGMAGGGGGQGTDDARFGKAGGFHYWVSNGQRMGGYGGDGGDERGLLGAGIIYHGTNGFRGGGGGGGGAPNATDPGGNSGAGGSGAVWIVSI
jgi:hypothetical protein